MSNLLTQNPDSAIVDPADATVRAIVAATRSLVAARSSSIATSAPNPPQLNSFLVLATDSRFLAMRRSASQPPSGRESSVTRWGSVARLDPVSTARANTSWKYCGSRTTNRANVQVRAKGAMLTGCSLIT